LIYKSGLKSVEPMAAITAPERTAAQHQSLLHVVGESGNQRHATADEVSHQRRHAIVLAVQPVAWSPSDFSTPHHCRTVRVLDL
jgi:hypothetical protein